MSLARGLVRLAAGLLPKSQRAIRLEEWSADLAHCGELGITERQVVLGALQAGLIDGLGWRTSLGRSRWLAVGSIAVVLAVLSIPAGVIAAFAIDQARGVVTVETSADGAPREVHWKEYPGKVQHGPDGYDEIDPAGLLAAPSAEQAWAESELLVAEIQAALTADLDLEWAPDPNDETWDYAEHPTANGYGGDSLLVVLNSPTAQTTSVPDNWQAKQRAIDLIADVAGRHGYAEPVLDFDQPWFDADEAATYGGHRPETAVYVPGVLAGPAGQWLSFSIVDPSLDPTGEALAERAWFAERGWQPATITLMYGGTLLPADARDEFRERLRAFEGYERPEPFVSD